MITYNGHISAHCSRSQNNLTESCLPAPKNQGSCRIYTGAKAVRMYFFSRGWLWCVRRKKPNWPNLTSENRSKSPAHSHNHSNQKYFWVCPVVWWLSYALDSHFFFTISVESIAMAFINIFRYVQISSQLWIGYHSEYDRIRVINRLILLGVPHHVKI